MKTNFLIVATFLSFGFFSQTIKINEFLASNSNIIADENGQFDDWIELYNPTSQVVNIAGYYLSDDALNPTKYRIPTTSTVASIPANGFLLIWADDQSFQGDLHTNFKLSATGDHLTLMHSDGTTLLDSLTYTAQSQNVSFGRTMDGQLPWGFFTTPTPNSSNNPSNLTILENEFLTFKIYPNPVKIGENIFISKEGEYEIFDLVTGKKILDGNETFISTLGFAAGIYLIRFENQIVRKFTVIN